MPAIELPDPPLTDRRVTLRPWTDDDAAWIARASRDPLVPRFTTVPADNTEARVRGRILAHAALLARGELVELLGVETTTGRLIGPVGLHHVEWTHRTAEVGYWTAHEARGRGLTTAAVRLICAWAFGPLGLDRVELRAHVDNPASQRVAEKVGFTREGILRGVQAGPEGARRSVVVFGLLAGELT